MRQSSASLSSDRTIKNNTTNKSFTAVSCILTVLVVLLVSSVSIAPVAVVEGVLFKDHQGPHVPDKVVFIGKPGGLLHRSTNAPTNKPTNSPTGTVPTASPTESPAPSPSPSSPPSADPDRITIPPTSAPTESPAPSPSPSSTPTSLPSGEPTISPSSKPTLSSHPSSNPTVSPAPSDGPTVSLSSAPSQSPSSSPTNLPSASPSQGPSYSPTKATQKMKTAITSLLLEDIPSEMDYLSAAQFELVTLEFLKKKIVPTEDYTLDVLAVNVLSQTVIYPEEDPTTFDVSPQNNNNRSLRNLRHLEKDSWTVALVVDIRTVGEVTDGRVPNTFNFTKVVDYAFYNHWDQYLWQLGSTVDFFEPLVDVSDYVPQKEEESIKKKHSKKDGGKSNAAFVLSILFSFVAFGLAIFASYIAIRKHLDNKNGRGERSNLSVKVDGSGDIFRNTSGRKSSGGGGVLVSPKNSPMSYSGPDVINYLTKTMSDESTNSYHDGDTEGGGATHLENVSLTPRASVSPTNNNVSPGVGGGFIRDGLYVVDEESFDEEDGVSSFKSSKKKKKNSPRSNTMMDETKNNQESEGLGGHIRKWLTPKATVLSPKAMMSTIRRTKNGGGNNVEHATTDDANNKLLSAMDQYRHHYDPPEEPEAVKASTKNEAGVYTTDKSLVNNGYGSGGPNTDTDNNRPASPVAPEGEFTLPISFFSNHRAGTDGNSGDDSPMSSLADSNASSFFAIGNMNKSFAGRRSSADGGDMANNYTIGGGGGGDGPESYSDENQGEPTLHSYNDNNNNNTTVQRDIQLERQKLQTRAPPAFKSKPGSVSVDSIMRTKSSENNSKPSGQYIAPPSILHTKSSDSETSAVQRLKAQFEGKQDQQPQYQYQQHQQPFREIHNTTNEYEENSLVGARSRDSSQQGQEIEITPSYDPSYSAPSYDPSYSARRRVFSPPARPDRSAPFGFGGSSGDQQRETARSEASTSTLGARPMDKTNDNVHNNDDDKSTLTTVMNRPESYDVYAPSGPIGVVVDTSQTGPAVHSLKATSPMLGLITPGDLIIALDGQDTRKLSAAALTRLMAKKSRQKERKITLFSRD